MQFMFFCSIKHSARYLTYVHAGITCQRPCRGQVITAQHCGDDSITIHLPDHGSIHKVDQSILIHCNACRNRNTA